ncbi:GRAM domain-containing protein 2B isoform X1 [Scyliorhinus canicula]|uniref:GRAM domain-containing protein 2B isoform X1 n=1 Tax=Scyliorhinus canicula TaxID=7830 RepID=UPI0018F34A82|nr:GRAM domain-containing protein 2B isoform X1 [Scyliorhinus canicula]
MVKSVSLEDPVLCLDGTSFVMKSSQFSPTESIKSLFASSEPENAGVEEKTKKTGKLLNPQLQSLNLDAEIFETKKRNYLTRSKTYDTVFPPSPTEYETKLERKKSTFNPSKTNATYHKLFKHVEKDEFLKQSFTCALQKDILYQGKLFVSENWICFNSKVFGRDIKIAIPAFTVTQIKKQKTALLVPNALCISTEIEKFMFVSLLSRDATYKLLKSVCMHLEVRSDDLSPNPSSLENSFRAERPISLPLEFNIEDLSDLAVCRRRELEQSSSSGSQTPESENSQEFTSSTQTLLKIAKNDEIPVLADVHIKEMPEVKRRSCHDKRHSLVHLLHRVKSNGVQYLSVNTLLVLYLIIVIVLVLSSFYMGLKIIALEQRLASLGALPEYHAHHKDSFAQRDMGLEFHINTDVIYDELSENLAKLEKIQKNLQKLLEGTE